MAVPAGWSAVAALAGHVAAPWQGTAWRAHKRKYPANDSGGSLRVSGRYNRGLDQFPAEGTWPALYLSLSPEVCLGEILRHISPELLPQLNDYRISRLSLELAVVLDCRDPAAIGLTLDDLSSDTDYESAQDLAVAAINYGAEGILVQSATRLGDNLIVFPARLRSESRITVIDSRDPRLYVPRRGII